MKDISFERIALSILLIVSAAGFGSYAITIAALGVMALDAFKFHVANRKQFEATKQELQVLSDKLSAIDKTIHDKVSIMDNKLAGMGMSRRNA